MRRVCLFLILICGCETTNFERVYNLKDSCTDTKQVRGENLDPNSTFDLLPRVKPPIPSSIDAPPEAETESSCVNVNVEFPAAELSINTGYDTYNPTSNIDPAFSERGLKLVKAIDAKLTSIISAISPTTDKASINWLKLFAAAFVPLSWLFVMCFTAPLTIYVRFRRPVWHSLQEYVPPHVIGYIKHSPRQKIFFDDKIGHKEIRNRFFKSMYPVTVEWPIKIERPNKAKRSKRTLTFSWPVKLGWREDKQPENWRNLISIQEQITMISTYSMLDHGIKDKKFGWLGYALLFFYGPVIPYYLGLWYVGIIDALFNLYTDRFLGFLAVVWAVFAIYYTQYIYKALLATTTFRKADLTLTLPTKTFSHYDDLVDTIKTLNNPILIGQAAAFLSAVFVISYLTFLDLK